MASTPDTAPSTSPEGPAPDAGAVTDEAQPVGDPTATGHAHPSELDYVKVALFLAATTGAQVAAVTAVVGVLWVASDWPVTDLAEGFLCSAHMVRPVLLTLVDAPLLLLGTPTWLARRLLGVRPTDGAAVVASADGSGRLAST